MEKGSVRKSQIELLRIIAIVLIIGHHLSAYGVFQLSYNDPYNCWQSGSMLNKIFSALLYPGGDVGVGIFFIISGYFLIYKEHIKLGKIISTSVFYGGGSVLVFVIMYVLGFRYEGITLSNLLFNIIRAFSVPASSGYWWFITAYIYLVLLSSILNKTLTRLNRKGFVIVLLLVWIFPYVIDTITNSIYCQLQKAIFFYLVGAYIRIYKPKILKMIPAIGLVISWSLFAICKFVNAINFMENMSIKTLLLNEVLNGLNTAFWGPICAISIFIIFINKKDFYNKKINKLATYTLGIYLLHDSFLVRYCLWDYMLDIPGLYMHRLFPIFSIGIICIVFIGCCVIEGFREWLFDRAFILKGNKVKKYIQMKYLKP